MNTSNSPSPSESGEMCLRWNSHHANIQTVFPAILKNEKYVDATLAADGQLIKCHKLVLSSCSEYFDEIFKDTYPMQHTVLYLRGIPFWVVKALVDFMYIGELNIDQMKLEPLLKAAEDLKIKGLTGKTKKVEEDIPPTIIEPLKEVFEKKVPEVKTSVKEVFEKKSPNKEVFEKKSPIKETKEIQKQTDEIVDQQKQIKKISEKKMKQEIEETQGMDDSRDNDFTPNHYYKKKLQVQTKKTRKRRTLTPPDPSTLKQVKINLKGTKSRPNIKQPKFYDPDYPEYDPDRSVSPAKIDTNDPIFNIDNIKMEPIDFEVPTSPSYSEISSLMDQTVTECESLEKMKTEKKKTVEEEKPTDEPKKIRKYAGKISKAPNFTSDKQAVFQTACSSIDIPPTILNKDVCEKIDLGVQDPAENKIQIDLQNKVDMEQKSTSLSGLDPKPTFTPIRIRHLPTTEQVLKKFATTNHLTSILRRESVPTILKRVASPKPAILRYSSAKKIQMIKANKSAIAEKLSSLAKTKKELTSIEDSGCQTIEPTPKHEVAEIEAENSGSTTD